MSFDELWPGWRPEWCVHEDDDLVVVDKPAGMLVQPSGRDCSHDLRSRLAAWLAARDGGCPAELGIMHGFDREASGLVVLGRSRAARQALAAELARGLRRRYLVAVEAGGSWARPKLRVSDPDATVRPRVVERRGSRMLLALETDARSQPIRRWLASLDAPLAGDRDHGGPPAVRLMLHAAGLELRHPRSGVTMTFVAPTPSAMTQWLAGSAPARLDEASLDPVLRDAAGRRDALARRADTNAFRLVHGPGDGLEGVTVDVYDEFLVASLTGEAAGRLERERLLDALFRLGPRGIYLKLPPKGASAVDTRRPDIAPSEAVRGQDAPKALVVRESGLRFEVRLGEGLSTGLFADQREARRRLRELAAGQRVLNLFGYTGAFTVAAAAGEARQTVTVDTARPALGWAARNLQANGLESDAHELVRADAFGWLARARRRREPFDLIVLDPPSFATTKRSRFRADTDYRRLACAALLCLGPGGRMLACTNHRGIAERKLRRDLRAAADDAGRRIARMQAWPCPPDFPPPPKGEPHLKSIWLATI